VNCQLKCLAENRTSRTESRSPFHKGCESNFQKSGSRENLDWGVPRGKDKKVGHLASDGARTETVGQVTAK